jgi:hypothetical protein
MIHRSQERARRIVRARGSGVESCLWFIWPLVFGEAPRKFLLATTRQPVNEFPNHTRWQHTPEAPHPSTYKTLPWQSGLRGWLATITKAWLARTRFTVATGCCRCERRFVLWVGYASVCVEPDARSTDFAKHFHPTRLSDAQVIAICLEDYLRANRTVAVSPRVESRAPLEAEAKSEVGR